MEVIINPGSGPVLDGSRDQSEINIKQFIDDLGMPVDYEFIRIENDGRHTYRLWDHRRSVEVEMPAIPLSNVRYLGDEDQNIWHFPRLYVNGSSWVWKYALGVCFDEDDED